MDFNIEKSIVPFIEAQFPSFYEQEGPNFIEFVKAYYSWMEENGKPLVEARNLFDYRDIDNTLEDFLEHFQKKYLYGIPFNVIINKRFLLKHILDVYRSKGSIQCYKLLFKLIYNQDAEIYLPGVDLFKPSDGHWNQEQYIEVSNASNLKDLVNKTIIGLNSGTQATIESYITEIINQNIISTLYISNVFPLGGSFIAGEKIIDFENRENENIADIVNKAPKILGSLVDIDILDGGQNYEVGTLLSILSRDSNNVLVSEGINGKFTVANTEEGAGGLQFVISHPRTGILDDAHVFIYRGNNDITGTGASFDVDQLFSTTDLTYNTDVVAGYLDVALNTTFNFPFNPTANISSNLNSTLLYTNNNFGALLTINNVRVGRGYTNSASIFVRSTIDSKNISGNVSYNSTSNTITGTNTEFQRYFSDNSVILLQADSSDVDTKEYQVIKTVVSNTSILLEGPPTNNSTATATYAVSADILPAQFALYETPMMNNDDDTLNGLNVLVEGLPTHDTIVNKLNLVDSGKAYLDGEIVTLTDFINEFLITGRVVKGGNGHHQGFWSSTAGFLSADKYLQDSFFYQDFSYQIKVASQLTKYRDILYKTFHTAGSELFGQFQLIDENLSIESILYESNATLNANTYLISDMRNYLKVDNESITVDHLQI